MGVVPGLYNEQGVRVIGLARQVATAPNPTTHTLLGQASPCHGTWYPSLCVMLSPANHHYSKVKSWVHTCRP